MLTLIFCTRYWAVAITILTTVPYYFPVTIYLYMFSGSNVTCSYIQNINWINSTNNTCRSDFYVHEGLDISRPEGKSSWTKIEKKNVDLGFFRFLIYREWIYVFLLVFTCLDIICKFLSRQISSKRLTLGSHRALAVSIVRLVIWALKCRIHGCLFWTSFRQRMRLIPRVWRNQGHWYVTVMVVVWRHERVLPMTRQSVAAWNIWTLGCTSGRTSNQWHHKCLAIWWRNVWAEVVVHGVPVTRWNCVKVGAVPKCGVRILAAGSFVLPSTRLVGVVGVLLAVNRSQSLGLHHEGLLLLIA